jgi:hypothetical protein
VGLRSAVDVCDVPIVSAAVAYCSSCEFMLLLLVSLLYVVVSSAVADFLAVCSGGPTTNDNYDVPIVLLLLSSLVLKGQCHEIFRFWFFSSISFPPALKYPIRTVSNFFENSPRYSQLKVDHRCR